MATTQSDILAAALDYARNGKPVFPVNPRNKKPYFKGSFKRATTDEQQIQQWWRNDYPGAMIGIPTGPRSKLWITDIDVDKAKHIDGPATLAELTAQHGPLPPTLKSLTPRGGQHYYFTWNGANIRNSSSQVGPGIDIRGEGGYVTAPPSKNAKGASYRWDPNAPKDPVAAPAWLVDLARKESKQRAQPQGATRKQSKQQNKPWARTALEQECERVANAPSGKRNDILNSAAFNLFQIVAGGGLNEQEVRDRLFEAAEACGLVADDGAQQAWATINSGAQGGQAQPRTRPSAQHQRAPSNLPRIRLNAGELPKIVDQAEQALLAAGGCRFYQRGDLLVRPVRSKLKAADDRSTFGWQLLPISKPYMTETLTRVAEFEKWDARASAFVPKDCPERIAETYLARVGHWRVPLLVGIVNIPILRRDGSICDHPGYDHDSGLLFEPDGQSFPSIAAAPSETDAKDALKVLNTLIKDFPFVSKDTAKTKSIDRAVALSGILTAFDRRSLVTAPLHAYTSPAAGTGKSLLVDIVSLLLTGELAPVISQGKNEEEFEKRLGTALISGDAVISIDNCEHPLAGSLLCQALTQQRLKIRLLGYSRHVEAPVNASIHATGNNLVIANDLTRRTLLCRLDAECEQPELRSFNTNVVDDIRADRGRYVVAALTILRAWHLAVSTGAVAIGVPSSFGSFEDWSERIRKPLIWLGEADPCDSVQTVRATDPERDALLAVLVQWQEHLKIKPKTVQQVIGVAVNQTDFFGALMAVAGSKQSPTISNDRLGRWLKRIEGKIISINERWGNRPAGL